jgi:UPF0755 protein
VTLLVLLVSVVCFGAFFLLAPVSPASSQTLSFPHGSSLHVVARQLEQVGVIRNARLFTLLARWRGDAARIHAGTYDFDRAATPGDILDRLVAGDVRHLQFTIPEGFDLRQIAARLEAAGIAPASEILRLAHDPEFLAAQGVTAPSLEGYLFPETYTISAGLPPERILVAMIDELKRHLPESDKAAVAARGLDVNDWLTLASIIQKEAGNEAEMPVIAAVFLNRLRGRIPLQADPTVIYGLGDAFNGNLTKKHLRQPTPYNTYTQRGLPPGPIASPGAKALQAVVAPAAVNYLYFVARGDGTHAFSRTLKEHNRAVADFQLHR